MKLMENFRNPASGENFYEPVTLKEIPKRINAWIRLWIWGFCPECNSDAPELYDCPVCKWDTKSPFSKIKKYKYWNLWKLNRYKNKK